MGKEYFKRPLYTPKVQTYSSGVDSTAGFVAYGGGFDNVVETGATGTDLKNYGVSLVGATGNKTYDIAAPSAGVMKYLFCTQSTGVTLKIRASTGGAVEFLTTAGGQEVLSFNNDGESAVLVGRNSSQYVVLSHVGAAFSTS